MQVKISSTQKFACKQTICVLSYTVQALHQECKQMCNYLGNYTVLNPTLHLFSAVSFYVCVCFMMHLEM